VVGGGGAAALVVGVVPPAPGGGTGAGGTVVGGDWSPVTSPSGVASATTDTGRSVGSWVSEPTSGGAVVGAVVDTTLSAGRRPPGPLSTSVESSCDSSTMAPVPTSSSTAATTTATTIRVLILFRLPYPPSADGRPSAGQGTEGSGNAKHQWQLEAGMEPWSQGASSTRQQWWGHAVATGAVTCPHRSHGTGRCRPVAGRCP